MIISLLITVRRAFWLLVIRYKQEKGEFVEIKWHSLYFSIRMTLFRSLSEEMLGGLGNKVTKMKIYIQIFR